MSLASKTLSAGAWPGPATSQFGAFGGWLARAARMVHTIGLPWRPGTNLGVEARPNLFGVWWELGPSEYYLHIGLDFWKELLLQVPFQRGVTVAALLAIFPRFSRTCRFMKRATFEMRVLSHDASFAWPGHSSEFSVGLCVLVAKK